MNRFRDTVTIHVPLPADEALPLFTARGEPRWAEGWVPEFPAGVPSEEAEGTVFVTKAGGRSTYWVVAARDADSIRYARTTPGFSAGTVEVRVRRSDNRSTQVDVTYDLTALTPEGDAELERFAARYEQDIGGWEAAIETTLRTRASPHPGGRF